MKKICLLLLIIFPYLASFSQDTWTVKHNKIEILNTSKTDAAQNVIALNQSELEKRGELVVTYKENNSQKKWVRYLVVYDGAENILMQKKGSAVLKISNASLKNLLLKNSVIKIYTWNLPADPKQAAAIRVRRLHLCTIELK